MPNCETATVSIGIRILLSDLVLQINETNFDLIHEMLNSGYVEDDNDYYNESYNRIIEESNKIKGGYETVKKYVIDKLKEIGSISFGGILFDLPFLLPLKVLLENDRWGHDYDSFTKNSVSRPLDFDLSVDTEKYKDIEKFTMAFILSQNSN